MFPPMQWIMRQNLAQCGFAANSVFQTETIRTITILGQAVPSKAACPTSTNRYPSPSPRVNFPRVGPRCSFAHSYAVIPGARESGFTLHPQRRDIEYQGRTGTEPAPITRQYRETNQCRNVLRSSACRRCWPLRAAATPIWNAGLPARPPGRAQAISSTEISSPAPSLAARRGFFATTLPTPARARARLAPHHLHHESDRPVLRAGRFAFEPKLSGANPAGALRTDGRRRGTCSKRS